MTLIISPIHKKFFTGKIWQGLEIDRLVDFFKEIKPEVDVQIIPFESLFENRHELPKNCMLFYTVSYTASYQQYIKDVIVALSQERPDIQLLPDIDMLFSFENKGYQELYKDRLGINSLRGWYLGDIDDFDETRLNAFPYVVKKPDGALSGGVAKVNDKEALVTLASNWKNDSIKERARQWYKKRRRKPEFPYQDEALMEYNKIEFVKSRNPMAIQEFIEGLNGDFKVLIFGDRYYTIQRFNRDGDFRASGSGKFSFDFETSQEVLEFALECKEKMKTAIVSLDIGMNDEKECFLFELQGIGFGPISLTNSTHYYTPNGKGWTKVEAKSDLEAVYAETLASLL